jgi:hypothetical protein
MTDGLVLFASAIGTIADGPVLLDPAVLFDRSVFIDRPVSIDQSVFIDQPAFIDRPAFIRVLWSGLDLNYLGLELDSASDRLAIERTGFNSLRSRMSRVRDAGVQDDAIA